MLRRMFRFEWHPLSRYSNANGGTRFRPRSRRCSIEGRFGSRLMVALNDTPAAEGPAGASTDGSSPGGAGRPVEAAQPAWTRTCSPIQSWIERSSSKLGWRSRTHAFAMYPASTPWVAVPGGGKWESMMCSP